MSNVMKTEIFSAKGTKVKEIELNKEVFGQKFNESLIHQVVTAEMVNNRQGDASTKTRAQIRGGGIKPWRQKGTGRARAGSIRSPLWVGGGITFGPQSKEYKERVPRKMRKAALRSILSAKAKDKEIKIVDKLDFKEPKTKAAKEVLDKLKIEKKSTVVIEKVDQNIVKAFRNLEKTNIVSVDRISSYALLDNEVLIITKGALDKLIEVLS